MLVWIHEETTTLRKEISEIKTDLKAHEDLQTKAGAATMDILETIENLKEELSMTTWIHEETMTLRKELSEIKTDLKEAHEDLQTKVAAATIDILKTVENLKKELSMTTWIHEETMTLRKELSEIKTDLKEAHEDLQTIQNTLKDAQDDLQNLKAMATATLDILNTGVTVKEKQKSTIEKLGEPVCKVAKHLLSSGLGSLCDVGVYGLNFVVEIVV